jgi:RHS repeat-associated protein
MNLGTQQLVAAIRDFAGNTTYKTNTVQLSILTNGVYSYNTAGCVTNIRYSGAASTRNTGLTWDGKYKLTSITTNGALAENEKYDAVGRRVFCSNRAQGDSFETNYFVYDGPHVVAEVNATGALQRAYVYGPGIDNLLAMTVHTGATAKSYFYLTDIQGSVMAVVDETASVVESYRYDAWGRVLGVYDGSGNPLTQSAIGNRYLWQGREYSWETGLYYFRARWYDPITGRWLSNDPIGISGGLNQYMAFLCNPVNFVDPSGLATYRQNRILAILDPNGTATTAPLTHTFVFTTNPNGTIKHTYSWGNDEGRWYIDRPNDLRAAKQAMCDDSVRGDQVGGDDLDPFIDQVYNNWKNDPAHIHPNRWVYNNCKTEAGQMIGQAQQNQSASQTPLSPLSPGLTGYPGFPGY